MAIPPLTLERYYGAPEKFIAWQPGALVRTDDITAAPPTWVRVDTGISGTLIDVQLVLPDSETVAAYTLTTEGVYYCADIEAGSPSWSQKLSLATVQAADAVPTDTSVRFHAMATHPTDADYLIVITGPEQIGDGGGNTDYAHAYSWHTHDGGDNWTQIDMNNFLLLTSSGPDVYRGYCYCSYQACEIDAEGNIYMIRAAPVAGVGSSMYVFISTDLGTSWTQGAQLPSLLNNRNVFSLTAPVNSIGYAVQGTVGVAGRPNLHLSTDDWVNSTEYSDPSGYGGIIDATYRVARLYNDPDHVRVWYRETATTEHHLRASDDQGATWTTLWEASPGSTSIVYAPPVNWPADPTIWVAVANDPPSGDIANVIIYSEDDFANRSDKSGNLEALLGTWSTGMAGGWFIPKPREWCIPNARYLYGGTEITDYCYEADLTNAPRALTKRTLGDTGVKAVAGVTEYSVRLAGDWSPTIDALFGVDSRSGVQRTGEILLDDCTLVVSYKWTNAARVTEWKIVTAATGKIVWSATLRHNGAAVRSLAN